MWWRMWLMSEQRSWVVIELYSPHSLNIPFRQYRRLGRWLIRERTQKQPSYRRKDQWQQSLAMYVCVCAFLPPWWWTYSRHNAITNNYTYGVFSVWNIWYYRFTIFCCYQTCFPSIYITVQLQVYFVSPLLTYRSAFTATR